MRGELPYDSATGLLPSARRNPGNAARDRVHSPPSNGAMKMPLPKIVGRLAGAMAVLVGIAVVLGWVLALPVLKSILPGTVTMKALTALCFILSGIAAWLGISGAGISGAGISGAATGRSRSVAMVCSVLVLLASVVLAVVARCARSLSSRSMGYMPHAMNEDTARSEAYWWFKLNV